MYFDQYDTSPKFLEKKCFKVEIQSLKMTIHRKLFSFANPTQIIYFCYRNNKNCKTLKENQFHGCI